MLLKSNVLAVVAGVALSIVGGSVAANELVVVDSGASKSGRSFSLDFRSDGRATALEVRLDIGARGKDAVVDVSKCATKLPATHTGSCVFNGEQLVVLVYSATNALLPAGMLDLGTVSIGGRSGGHAKGVRVAELIVAGPDAQPVTSNVVIDGVSK